MMMVVVVVVMVMVMVIEVVVVLCLDVWPEQCYGWPQLVARGRDGGEEGVVGCLNPASYDARSLTHLLNSHTDAASVGCFLSPPTLMRCTHIRSVGPSRCAVIYMYI